MGGPREVQDKPSFKWDWNHSSQSRDYFVGVKNKLVNKLLDNKSGWRRLSGFPLGFACPFLFITRQTALVGEQTIKGFANLIGCCLPRKCLSKDSKFSALKGLKQLALVPWNLLRLVTSPIGLAFSVVLRPIHVGLNPVGARSTYKSDTKADAAQAKKNAQKKVNDDLRNRFGSYTSN